MITLLLARLVAAQLAGSSTVLATPCAVPHTQRAAELVAAIVGMALARARVATGHARTATLHAAPVRCESIEVAWGAGQMLALRVVAAEDR
eukprot:3792825-Rhodomonas_salina.1